jgi:hypothetical protein
VKRKPKNQKEKISLKKIKINDKIKNSCKCKSNSLKQIKLDSLKLNKNIINLVNILYSETPCCGKPLRALITTLYWKLYKGPRLIAVHNSNNIKDWAIRSVII